MPRTLPRPLLAMMLSALLAIGVGAVAAPIAFAQGLASDGSVAPDITGPCSVQADIIGVGRIDPAASGGVYTIPHAGEASYIASVAIDGEDREHDGAVFAKTPPGVPSIDIHDPWNGLADDNSDSGTVTWDIPSWVPGGVEIVVSGYHNDSGQRCEGSLVFKLDGGIFDSPIGFVSLALTALGAVGMGSAAIPVQR